MKWSNEEKKKAINLLKEGLTYKEISDSLQNRNYNSVKRKLIACGYSYSMYGGKPEELPDGYKRCRECDSVKELTEFNKNVTNKDGYQTRCRVCSNEKSKYYYYSDTSKHKENVKKGNVRRKLENSKKILEYLKDKKCIDCPENDPIVLEFDHIEEYEKINDISVMVCGGYGWQTILDEINKCEIRCANCHRRKTAKQFGWYKYINQ